jgi:ubiquinol-cytochrome c reductase iron-sulfur subunit
VLAGAGFVVLYVYFPDVQLLGLCAGLVCVGFAIAAVVTGKGLVPQEKAVTEYHWFGDEESHEDVEEIVTEAGDGISRRKLLAGAAGLAGASATAAAVVPIASLGPHVGRRLAQTPWQKGRRLVSSEGEPIRAADIHEGSFTLALPEGSDPRGKLGDPVNVLRFPLDQLDLPDDRKAKCPEGIVAYSRICTHAGCAVTMYRTPLFNPNEPKPALVCPCHYSTFDPTRSCAVDFGPAARPLPQLPLRINEKGELEADGDFYEPVGPSYGGVRLQGNPELR